jgi:low affinity Fe/Cu permease
VTNVITFLMVFVIQNSQNRDSAAIQAKLDELIRVTSSHHELIGIEDLPEDKIEDVKSRRKKGRAPLRRRRLPPATGARSCCSGSVHGTD